jgi:hypothetical protein
MPTPPLASVLSAAVCAVLCAPATAAECQRSSFTFGLDAQSVHSTWRMAKNMTCSQSIHLNGNDRLNFKDWKIARRPVHGIAGIQDSIIGSRYAYQPRSEFSGKDSFEVSVQVLANPTPYTLTIDVDVDVAPSP